MRLPSHLWIVGPCGCGKTALAERLADALGLPAIHLDDIHWNPGWVESSPDHELQTISSLLERHRRGWIIDGNYGHIRKVFSDRADLFIWLDLPFTTTFPRLVLRHLRRAITGETVCNGNRESWAETFLSRRSILLYAVRTHRWRRRTLAVDLRDLEHVRLRRRRDVSAWLGRCSRADASS